MSHSSYHSMIVPPYPNLTCRTLHTVLYSATLYILAQVRHFQARFLNRSCPHKLLEKGWKTVFPNLSNFFSRWQFLSAFFDLDGRDQESSRTFQHTETLHFRAFARTSETTQFIGTSDMLATFMVGFPCLRSICRWVTYFCQPFLVFHRGW